MNAPDEELAMTAEAMPAETANTEVSVVLSVYGNWDDLPATMDSILSQSLRNFEVVLIDDGNPQEGAEVIRQVAKSDSRINLVVNESNIGLTKSLIRGCEIASADFIARIDCGDLMAPRNRLELQLGCFKDDPDLGLVCGGIEMWDLVNKQRWQTRLRHRSHKEIACLPRYVTWADHPTVMMKKSVYEASGGYDAEMVVAQDTELWPRMAEHGNMLGLPVVMAVRTLKSGSISVSGNTQQIRRKIAAIKRSYKDSDMEVGFSASIHKSILISREYLKLLVPIKIRMRIRHKACMDFVGNISLADNPSLDTISSDYFKCE